MVAAAMLMAMPLAAQGGPGRGMGGPGGPMGMGMNMPTVEELTKALDLDAGQQAQVGDLLKTHRENLSGPMRTMQAMREARQRGVPQDSLMQMRPAMQEAMKQARDEQDRYESEMRSVLRPEQLTRWEAFQDERRRQMRERMGGMGGPGQGPPRRP